MNVSKVIHQALFVYFYQRAALRAPLTYMSHFTDLLEGQMEIRSFEAPNSQIKEEDSFNTKLVPHLPKRLETGSIGLI